jgi:DNA-damage-inducible protein D
MTDEQKAAVEGESQIQLFQKKEIRQCMHGGEWWFSVKDILEALTDTTDGARYARGLRSRDEGLQSSWEEITRSLKYDTGNGGTQETTFVNIEGIFRIIQSVPTKKAEPFKKWLAKVGFERLQEINNPELAVKRAITYYRAKGYNEGWIEARIQNKASREKPEAEWYNRGVTRQVEFAVLTNVISRATFGIETAVHKALKGLKGQSLRDNMTPIELTLTTLGEQATVEIAKSKNARGMYQNKEAAQTGGAIARDARIKLEQATGTKVVSKENYLTDRQKKNLEIPEDISQSMKRMLDSGKGAE